MIYKCYTYVALLGLLISVVSGASAQQVDVSVFQQSIQKKDAQVFDVRTAGEFNTGHLHNALQADYTKKGEFIERVQYLDKEQAIYIYCLSGGRSTAAAKWLRENGFREVIELKGGINAWKQAGLPVEGVADVQQMSVDTFHMAVASGDVLVDVGAEWCPPCRKMEPVIQAYLKENKKVRLLKVDGGRDREVMQAVNATSLPTFILYRDGREVWRKQGVSDKL
ncbi:Rhodanese-related sulfurtransferase [Chitinophaga filiformis]|uniref:Rhodanese-related sulfurtransferase n=1 Tax=Chitinophaga filiformis TaxID=104663 RepID=A0A1G7GH08_CHIFI|nr:Rhodanese-related sulfurtransferase [Chitinophaga filiformis]